MKLNKYSTVEGSGGTSLGELRTLYRKAAFKRLEIKRQQEEQKTADKWVRVILVGGFTLMLLIYSIQKTLGVGPW